jgi:phosphate transport system substrate-binding protein
LLPTSRISRVSILIALTALTALSLFAVACGGGDDDGDASGVSGSVAIDGSSTVFPVTEAVAEEFRAVEPGVRVTVGVSGTGGGFKKFCAGETDISDASRPIKESEQADCAANGVEYLELRVGLDGLAVVTNPETDFLDGLTLEELALIWSPESEGEIMRWSQVRAGFPDEAIQLFGPGTDSGTFDFFTEVVNGEGGASRADFTASEDDNVLVVGVSGTEGGLGYFGYAYFAENSSRLTVVPVDGVTPSDATVSDGSYPLARPLFIYVSKESLAEKASVREFVRFYLSDEGIALVPEVGYTNIATAELEESRSRLEAAIGG